MNLDNNETKRPITLYEKMDVILTEDEINVLLIILKTWAHFLFWFVRFFGFSNYPVGNEKNTGIN